MRKMLERLNKAPLTVELMQAALQAIGDLQVEKGVDVTGRIIAIIEVLEKGASGQHRAILGLSINFRLLALARLMLSNDTADFEIGRCAMLGHSQDDLLSAAVEVPLRARAGEFVFDPGEFQNHLLALTQPAGTA